MKRLVPGLVIGALALSSTAAMAADGDTLAQVKERGEVICGVNGGLPGMSVLNSETGIFEGMDGDYCRAVAAAIFGDDSKVKFTTLTADQRATAVQGGEIDVLFRNTTQTFTRDATWGDFGPVILYDGQGMMVRVADGISTLEDLDGATICVTSGTTTEQNLADQMTWRGIEYTPVVAAEIDTVYTSYEEGRCDAVTSDRSQLAGRKSATADPSAHVILEETISKEPLAPLTAHGDNNWNDIISWIVYATIEAEELGITSENIGEFAGSANPVVARFLGETGELGSALGLENDFVVDVISAVGNYGQIYERGFGADSGIELPREAGPNALWTDGGLMYSPPFK